MAEEAKVNLLSTWEMVWARQNGRGVAFDNGKKLPGILALVEQTQGQCWENDCSEEAASANMTDGEYHQCTRWIAQIRGWFNDIQSLKTILTNNKKKINLSDLSESQGDQGRKLRSKVKRAK